MIRVILGLAVGIAILAGGYVYTQDGSAPSTQPQAVKVRPVAPAKPLVDDSTKKAIEGLNLRGSGD
jgi:hypothetical protein